MAANLTFDIVARDRASAKFDHLSNSVDHSSDKMDRLKRVGRTAALGLAAGIGIAVVAGKQFAQAAADDETSAALMAKTFKNAAGATKEQVSATEDWITKVSLASGVADDDMRPALSRLVTATHDVGKAQQLMKLAMDVSAGSGKSLESVSTALMKAQNGQVSSLSRLGIQTKDAEGKLLSMDQVTKNMANTFGGAMATKAATAQGSMDRLKVMFNETSEAIGYKLLPILTTMMNWIIGTGVPAVQKFVAQMKSGEGSAGKLAAVLTTLKNVVVGTTKFLLQHKEAVALLVGAYLTYKVGVLAVTAAQKVATAATKVWAAGQWLLNIALTANPIGLVVVAIGLLAGGIYLAYKKSETFRAGVKMVWDFLRKFIGFTPMGALILNIDKVADAIGYVIGKAKELWDWLGKLADKAGGLKGILGAIPGGGALGGLFGRMGQSAGKSFAAGFKSSWVGSNFVVNSMVDVLQGQFDQARDALAGMRDARNASFGAFQGFGGNLFGADISGGSEGTGPTGIDAILAFGAAQAAQSQQVATDVAHLVGLGLSQELIDQMKSQGASGIAQIHALAGATPAQIAQANAQQAASTAALTAAGVATAGSTAAMTTAGQAVSALAAQLLAAQNNPVPLELHLHLEGKTLVTSIKAYKRGQGNVPLGIA